MTDHKAVMQQALAALEAMQMEAAQRKCGLKITDDSIIALRDAIAQPEQRTEQNFCARCGKRLVDDGIHTCTPPKDKP